MNDVNDDVQSPFYKLKTNGNEHQPTLNSPRNTKENKKYCTKTRNRERDSPYSPTKYHKQRIQQSGTHKMQLRKRDI